MKVLVKGVFVAAFVCIIFKPTSWAFISSKSFMSASSITFPNTRAVVRPYQLVTWCVTSQKRVVK
ncbi:hypothetical protein GGR15_004460 [Butyricimonas paravirosa]|uniref:Uncharacterized protein n=1 Tax=Butyricimonas paravirosa TaxID=1472417 RepID=A0A7X5YGN1_9BACT|nr:hypothetical protein [Butyricimonas paravirosa]